MIGVVGEKAFVGRLKIEDRKVGGSACSVECRGGGES